MSTISTLLKNLLSYTILILVFSGCFTNQSTLTLEHDHFKKVYRKTYAQELKPAENQNQVYSAKFHFTSERPVAGTTEVNMYCVISGSFKSFQLEPTVYFMANKDIYTLPMEAYYEDDQQRQTEQTEQLTSSENSMTSSETSYTTEYWTDNHFQAAISDELLEAIKQNDHISIRVYAGGLPYTFEFKGSKMKKLMTVAQF